MFFTSFLILAGIGFAAAVILTIASKFFYVQEDPKIAMVSEALPGANCGGCGYAGCDGYAAAVVGDPSVPANLCCVGGPDTIQKVGQLTGKSAGDAEPVAAFRRCERNEGQVETTHFYDGMDTCAAAVRLNNGTAACTYACVGYGDCVKACQFNALVLEDGMPLVLSLNCTGCGNCVKACPRNIMTLVPKRARVMVHCSTQDKLKAVSDVCQVGCISCMRCVKACPAKALKLINNRIEVDHAKCLEFGFPCLEVCVDACPRKILRHKCQPCHDQVIAEESGMDAGEAAPPSAGEGENGKPSAQA